MITSPTNPKIKYVRRLQTDKRFRRREQLFVAEGTRWLKEVIAQKVSPQLILATERWLHVADHQLLWQHLVASKQIVSEQLFSTISETETPSGILFLLPIQFALLPTHPSLLLILDGVSNPGNLGTMVRTAAAAGVDGVILGPNCVDPYNSKVVRGSMGAILRLPVLTRNWPQIQELVVGMAVWVAVVGEATPYTAVSWQQPSAIIIGSEAHGVSEDALTLTAQTRRMTIPMASHVESLNAAMATGIVLFEAVRQRSL